MIRPVVVLAIAVFLGACGSETTKSVTLKLVDADGNPVPHARLICHDDSTFLGATSAEGLLTIQVSGANTPGRGFMPDCQVAYFRTDNDQFGRHFWFARWVRGEAVSAGAHAVELVDVTG